MSPAAEFVYQSALRLTPEEKVAVAERIRESAAAPAPTPAAAELPFPDPSRAEPPPGVVRKPITFPYEPRDEWERRLLSLAIDCGVSLTNEQLSREYMYD